MLGRLDNALAEGGAANKPSNDVTTGHERYFGFNLRSGKRWAKVRRNKAAESAF